MIPSDIKFEGNAAPPQWTDGADQVIEKGTNIRIKIKGIRSEVDKMYAVGTMKEVGSPQFWISCCFSSLTPRRITLALCRSKLTTAKSRQARPTKAKQCSRWWQLPLARTQLSALRRIEAEPFSSG